MAVSNVPVVPMAEATPKVAWTADIFLQTEKYGTPGLTRVSTTVCEHDALPMARDWKGLGLACLSE